MKDKKHLYWVVGLVLITIILCGTLIWINHNSWTLRFEMDDNTKEAIQSIEFDKINQIESNKHHGEPSLANKVERFKIYVKTWSQIFDEFEISHEWLNKKLQVEKDIIIQELATADEGVRKAIDSSAAHS